MEQVNPADAKAPLIINVIRRKMINSKKTLLAYLDILGYKEIISNSSPEVFYKSIVSVFDDIKKLWDGLYPAKISSNSDLEKQCNAEIVSAINFNIMSDSIMISLHYKDIERINKKFYKLIDNDYSGIVSFFHVVSTFVLRFMDKVGYLLRGGICFGEFYSNTFNDSLLRGELIYSKAFVEAYLLEQEAVHPRILVDKSLYELWHTKVNAVSKQFLLAKAIIARDMDGEYYLDVYEIMRKYPVEMKKTFIDDIIKRIAVVMIEKADDKKVWKKWYWFKEYHNKKIRAFGIEESQVLDEFLIK